MYMIIDVNSPLPGEALTSYNPWESYHEGYLNRTFAIVEAFKSYPNTLLFFSGNEVIDRPESAEFGPRYIRAVTRDLKNYIKKHSQRYIPVGYSAADVRDILWDSWNYFTCRIKGEKDDESRADVFGLNSYSWCGDATFESSTFKDLVDGFKDTSVPIFFSEFGCNEVTPRLFTEIAAIYGDKMTGVFSGGMVYEYTQEENNYGLVELDSDGNAKLLQDYNTLAKQYAALDFDALYSQKPGSDTPDPVTCDAKLITQKGFDKNFTIPEMPHDNSAKILSAGVKPAPSGKIVPVTDLATPHKVVDVDGKELSGVAIKAVADNGWNRPGVNTAFEIGAAAAGGNSTSKEDAGAFLRPTVLALALPLFAYLV